MPRFSTRKFVSLFGAIIVILAGGGFLAYKCFQTTPLTPSVAKDDTATWVTYADQNGFEFKYPPNFGANVWRPEFWPPKAAVVSADGDPVRVGCPDIQPINDKGDYPAPQKIILNNLEFSLSASQGVGAGSLYSAYCYVTKSEQKYFVLEFFIHSHTGCYQGECGAYCGTQYEQECRQFDLTRAVESKIQKMVTTFKFVPPFNSNNPMKITSVFGAGAAIPNQYSCNGGGEVPPLQFSAVPGSAKSLALILEDPDAPRGTFIHWVVWNLPPDTSAIVNGALPAGAVVGRNTTGKNDYVPPCPPSGTHRYIFRLYALDTILALPASADKSQLEAAMSGHALDSAELIGLYSK